MSDRPVTAAPARLSRQDVLEMVSGYRAQVSKGDSDDLDSLELAWLLHQTEQRYGVELDLEDADLSRMNTVAAAAEVLTELVGGRTDG
ncbi:hypothetical protein [Actinokineospora inagensis]|uniref:hypothetical protein n=1 Tax=Actinokineospora inagensis TaxID=103730 RepID=UPI000412142B|nr:hypothetical protein [Actinokineospora inagensis]